jgi:hypothetical protein
MLEQLQSVRELASGESEDPRIARWCARGETLVTKLAEVVHRDRDPWSIDDREIRVWLTDGISLAGDSGGARGDLAAREHLARPT